jgi:ABC-type nitrate/sulfonate/bicarbonate transport system ATPase subunit
MESKFIKLMNSVFGDKTKTENKPIATPVVNETKKESVSFKEIKSFFTPNKKQVPILINAPQIAPENFVVKTTLSGLKYEEKETLLKVENVSLSFGDKLILRDVSFDIRDIVRPGVTQGQIISLIGKSGIGKTQLFKILAGLTPKENYSGNVFVGRDLKRVKAGDVGVVPQNYLMFNHRTVRKNFELAINKNPKIDAKDRELYIQSYVEKFNIKEHLDKYPQQLSGGQKQRASIVQQILNGGDFIFFDEPFSGLDCIMLKKTINVLKNVALEDELRTLIIISHDIANSCSISDTVFILGLEGDKPGAVVKKKIDLMERDLAWKDETIIKRDPKFIDTIEEIESLM